MGWAAPAMVREGLPGAAHSPGGIRGRSPREPGDASTVGFHLQQPLLHSIITQCQQQDARHDNDTGHTQAVVAARRNASTRANRDRREGLRRRLALEDGRGLWRGPHYDLALVNRTIDHLRTNCHRATIKATETQAAQSSVNRPTFIHQGVEYPVGTAYGMRCSTKHDDPAYPERQPERYRRIKCAVCRSCWLDIRSSRCQYGGPFSGFTRAST